MKRLVKTVGVLIAVAAFAATPGLSVVQAKADLVTPPPGEIWVYPEGEFPDDFYSLWLAINGTPYAAAELPYPYISDADPAPDSRPVFSGVETGGIWTVVLKARSLEVMAGGYTEGPFTAFNLGLAAGTELINKDPVLPVKYMLVTDKNRFSTGFGEISLRRPVAIVGESVPGGAEHFFRYTPNFDPAISPDTNPSFAADWLPADYPVGSEYDPAQGYGVRSAKSVIYGGFNVFHVRAVSLNYYISNCLFYGTYGVAIRIEWPSDEGVISGVDIRHTYHGIAPDEGKAIGGFTLAIYINAMMRAGGQHLIDNCMIDQELTWMEHYFLSNPYNGRFTGYYPGGHAVYLTHLSKGAPDDYVHIRNSSFTNCGSNCLVYDSSDVDLRIEYCDVDGGYSRYVPDKDSTFHDWRGNCIIIHGPSVDQWGNPPAIEIANNQLIARGCDAYGVRLHGCGNGEAAVVNNTITCAAAVSSPWYASGIELYAYGEVGCNGNMIAGNLISGVGGWAINVNADTVPCEGNLFVDNDLSEFTPLQAGAVHFGPQANDNVFIGDVGAGIVDEGTGNVINP